MNLTVIAAPQFEPVTLSDCYTHLRLDPDGSPLEHPDDAMLLRHIATARQTVEALTSRALITQTMRLSTAGWPSPARLGIRLHRAPVREVLSVRYFDGTNTLQTLRLTEYYLTDEQLPAVRVASAFSAPTLYDRPDAVRIEFVAGEAPVGSPADSQAEYAAAVKQVFKDAILLTVQLLYDQLAPDQREALTKARDAMLFPHKLLQT